MFFWNDLEIFDSWAVEQNLKNLKNPMHPRKNPPNNPPVVTEIRRLVQQTVQKAA